MPLLRWMADTLACCARIVLLGALFSGATRLVHAQESPAPLDPVAPAAETQPGDQELIDTIVELLRDNDQDMRTLAYEQIQAAAPGTAATARFAAELPNLNPDLQLGLIRALATRGDAAARPALLPLLNSERSDIHVTAIEALGLLGDGRDVPALWQSLRTGPPAESAAARGALQRMTAADVNGELVKLLQSGLPASARVTLLNLINERRATTTVPALLQSALDPDAEVRGAAMAALGQLGSAQDLPILLKAVLAAKPGAERAAAEKAVMFVCQRAAPADAPAAPLLAAMSGLSNDDRLALLTTLARVGGTQARDAVERAIQSRNPQEHAAGVRAISNWPTAEIAPRLVELIGSEAHADHRTLVLRALIRLATLPDARSDADRLTQLQAALALCQRDADREFVVQRAASIRTVESLRFLLPFVKQPQSMEAACTSIVELAHHRALRDAHKDEFLPALDLVIATSHDATTVERANRYKNNQTWVRPK